MNVISSRAKAKAKGQLAEAIIATHLRNQHWYILARNYRRPACEIDIIARKNKLICFIEVKYRQKYSLNSESYLELLTESKKKALLRGADFFLKTYEESYEEIRFDLFVLTKQISFNELERIKKRHVKPKNLHHYDGVM